MSQRKMPGGNPGGAIDVELLPDPSDQAEKPDDVSGPQVAETAAATSQQPQADDPDPPAPDSAAPTETVRKPDAASELTAPPAPADAQALLPPKAEPEDRPPDPEPVEKNLDAEKAEAERQTAASRASSGSVARLEGGRRPSAKAKATWAGEIGTHLAQLRRYPMKARAEGWQGTARVRVTLDDNGHVTDRELVESSGRHILDDEALALMERSDPFPKPPTGMRMPIVLTVPVKFALR